MRENFQVIPAVDVVGSEAVRLRQGSFDDVVARAGDPADLVARFAAARPPLVHVVDLDGARTGSIRPELVGALAAAAAPTPVQASGGIRSLEDARSLLDAGAFRVVVGTAALDSPAAVAVAGWSRTTKLSPDEFAERCAEAGVHRLLCTSIDRDGTMAGPDLDLLGRVRERSELPVLAAGGLRSEEDVEALAALGLEGAVVGRAVLEGAITL
jgi:phosphoribosylformimino-5-aminoimidazole carboxamide ribotide isomerase